MGRRPQSVLLKGWKSIATALSVSVKTARRWERKYGLPIHRCPRPVVLITELQEWIKSR